MWLMRVCNMLKSWQASSGAPVRLPRLPVVPGGFTATCAVHASPPVKYMTKGPAQQTGPRATSCAQALICL